MKVFYFGSVCSNIVFNDTVEKSRVKPSASAQNFEYALMKGFSAHPDVSVTVASAESIAAFPNGNRLFLRKRRDELTDRIAAHILPALNLPGIKQSGHAYGAVRLIRQWIKANQSVEDKCVLVYGVYPKVAELLIKECKKHRCKIFAIITDVPSAMFTYTKNKGLLKRLFSDSYRRKAISLQDRFDGYVYLTEAMQEEVAPGKPYIVVETMADTTIFDEVADMPRATPPAIMYAGALYKKYGVDLIVDVFEKVKIPSELWLFGSGDYETEIQHRASLNSKIKFFGRVSREEVLRKEREASLLLNIRNAEDDYTKYSFPSKMIEYMLSGTPLFTTRLAGIPDEYYAYCLSTDTRDIQKLAEQIDNILTDVPLQEIGNKAKRFVEEQKNSDVQARKILDFLGQQSRKG